ncbi:MAG: superoxide dismutase [Microscillaceae bacterium]|nr:superoxide dismutase [Microscillaceae bacterium]MDW8461255.1 superoxide dismutase [Cytophagales bacterium]
MDKRTFLKTSLLAGMGIILNPMWTLANNHNTTTQSEETTPQIALNSLFTLPNLPYPTDALEPYIDKQTMEIHHGKHHATYVKNLNEALEKNPAFTGLTIEQICQKVTYKHAALRNNGGGHYNHSFFWEILTPAQEGRTNQPTGNLAKAINQTFGSFEKFQEEFTKVALSHFGSGWAWLCMDKNKKLFISSTPNQDNPLMSELVKQIGTPILALDVWEHAYYLKYQNRRADYVKAFWNVVNWEKVAQNFEKIK